MTTAPGLLAQSIAAGVLDPAAMLDGAISVYPQSRSNVVHRIEVAGRPFAYVKQRGAASRLDGDDAVANERAALAALVDYRWSPKLLPVADPAAVWIAAVPGEGLDSVFGDTVALLAASRAIGAALAALHDWPTTATHASPLDAAPLPWALRPDALPASMRPAESTPALSSVIAASAEPEIRAALERAAAAWRPERVIHGDLSAGNIIVSPLLRGVHGGARCAVTLIDFESSGLGDPGWDLATVVGTVEWLATDVDTARLASDLLLAEYARGGGAVLPTNELLCARALHSAWQAAASGFVAPELTPSQHSLPPHDPIEAQVRRYLEEARSLAGAGVQSRYVQSRNAQSRNAQSRNAQSTAVLP